MRLWRIRSNHHGRTRRASMLLGAIGAALGLCLAADSAFAWPRQFGPFAYVTADGGVAVVDIASRTKTASIPLGDWSGPIAVTRDGNSIYAGYKTGTTAAVAAIDAGSNTVKARIAITGTPTAIFTNAKRNSVYVVHKSGAAGAEATSVAVIDFATNAIVADVALGHGDIEVHAPKSGDWFAALNRSADALITINAQTNAVGATVPLDGFGRTFDVSPDGERAFVLRRRNDGPSDIAVVNVPVGAVWGNVETNFAVDKDSFGVVAVPAVGNRPALAAAPYSKPPAWGAMISFSSTGWTYPDQTGLWFLSTGVRNQTTSLLFGQNNFVYAFNPNNFDIYWQDLEPFGGFPLTNGPGRPVLSLDQKWLFMPASNAAAGPRLQIVSAQTVISTPTTIPFSSISDVAIVEPQFVGPFDKFGIVYLDIAHRATAGEDLLNFYGEITTYRKFDDFGPDVTGMTVEVGSFTATISPGKFKKAVDGSYVYNAWVGGVVYNAYVRPLGANKYLAHLLLRNAPLPQIANPAQVRLSFGSLGGLQAAIATIR